MKFKTLLIILILTFFPVSSSYSEINRFYAYICVNEIALKVKNYIIYPCVMMMVREERAIRYEISTTISFIGIYANIDGKMIWKDRKVKIGKPEENGKYNYYIYFEIIDSLGNNVCKDPEKAVIKRNYELGRNYGVKKEKGDDINHLNIFIFFKKSFINKLKEGKYKLKTTLYERKEDGRYESINSYDDEFIFMNINNPIIRDSKASFFALAGNAMDNRYRWTGGKDKYIRKTAEELLTKSVELNTNLRFVYRYLIRFLLQDKRYKEIIEVLDKWVSVRDTAVDLMVEIPLRKDSLPISRRCLKEILKKVYGDKAELELKKYYPDDKKKD